jgi:chitinase
VLPERVVAGYYPNWTESPVRIRDVPASYNVIYLFAAKPVGGSPGSTGAVEFKDPGDGRGAATNLNADIKHARTMQQRKIILSVGGAGAGMSFPNRQKSQTFVSSIDELYTRLGGFDGMDWNTFEADQAPDTDEMIWISKELKRLHPGFLITAPPAPWNELDQAFCQTMVEANAMDYVAPQYYDGPNLATQGYITQNVDLWVNLVGAKQLVVGFGIWDQANYMAIGDAVATWKQLDQKHPTLRGAFDWSIHLDEGQGWPFANELGPLVAQ